MAIFRRQLFPFLALFFIIIFGVGLDLGANRYVQLIMLFSSVNIILALSLNLVNGFTGQFSIGHAGFMAIGAYVSAYLSMRPEGGGVSHFAVFPPALDNFNFFIYSIVGGLAAACAGYAVGLPSLRLRGDYLAIVTLGFGEIIRVALLNMQSIGGARGMYDIPAPEAFHLGPLEVSAFVTRFAISGFWVVLTFTVLWRLIHSAHGRAFLSIREDEIAAQSMGVNTTQVKVRAFVISSFFAGIAGSIFAEATQYLNPSTFGFSKSVDAIIMIVLGGMGSLTGSVIAAILITILPEFILRPLQEITHIDFRMVIYSLTLIVFMITRPQGIFGMKEWPDLWRALKRRRSPKGAP